MAKVILFIKPLNSSFILRDESFFKEKFKLESFLYKYGNVFRHFFSQLQLLSWLFVNITNSDIIYIWFSDYHTWLPVLFAKIFKKTSIVAVAGYDVACISELDYGVFVRKFRGWCSRFSIRHANYVTPVANSLKENIDKYIGKINGDIIVAPFGFDEKKWYPSGQKNKNTVLTVAIGDDLKRLRIKGLDLFAEVASQMPNLNFIIVGQQGIAKQYLEQKSIKNLRLVGPVQPDELLKFFQDAKVYAQLSIREGLPNAVCEAMLCECVPVGTNVGGIPDAIGETGFIIEKRTCEASIEAINAAVAAEPSLGSVARERIRRLFSEEKRRKALSKMTT